MARLRAAAPAGQPACLSTTADVTSAVAVVDADFVDGLQHCRVHTPWYRSSMTTSVCGAATRPHVTVGEGGDLRVAGQPASALDLAELGGVARCHGDRTTGVVPLARSGGIAVVDGYLHVGALASHPALERLTLDAAAVPALVAARNR